ncbi:MAG: hypothetical protein Q8R07_05260, partial [Candidatus Uhrbacteria bacterium]|nr:hypothetical protein [Candidatus Uhrbacteria bacterium]
MPPKIIPAILTESADELLARIRLVEPAAREIQIDILDGTLVASTGWNDPEPLRRIKIRPSIELHLMVNDPASYIQSWRAIKNFKRAVWHVEAPVDHARLIAGCHKQKLQAGLAISPETPVAALVPFLRKLDTVLILGVHPGWSGQKLIPATLKKIDALKHLAPKLPIGFDGGVENRNARSLTKRGVTYLYMGSGIFKQPHPA